LGSLAKGSKTVIGDQEFSLLAQEYWRRCRATLVCVDAQGALCHGKPSCQPTGCLPQCAEIRRRAVFEALRWGEPSVTSCPGECAVWAVPLMTNSRVYGGLVALGVPLDKDHLHREFTSERIREACTTLRLLAEEHNLTNSALLELRRLALDRETDRAKAIHLLKSNGYDSIREIYLREEAALLAAVKRGERKVAREILNRVLVGIYHFGSQRKDLLKSVILELVVMLCRAAVEAGAEPSELLGANFHSITELAALNEEKDLCHWLTNMLERQMDAIRDHRQYPNTVLLGKAMAYMREHVGEELDRDVVARTAGLSGSHFSHLLKAKLGQTFTQLLGQYRIDQARQLIVRTTHSFAEIAAECGFTDQSYFGKVFQRYTGLTPGDYRRRHADWHC
jgi:AraC-like DNA-binding protein